MTLIQRAGTLEQQRKALDLRANRLGYSLVRKYALPVHKRLQQWYDPYFTLNTAPNEELWRGITAQADFLAKHVAPNDDALSVPLGGNTPLFTVDIYLPTTRRRILPKKSIFPGDAELTLAGHLRGSTWGVVGGQEELDLRLSGCTALFSQQQRIRGHQEENLPCHILYVVGRMDW